MNFSEIDYEHIDEDELYKRIFKECNIDDFLFNQSTTAYSELKKMLAYTMLKNGISKIMSENDVDKVINSIKKDWIIEGSAVISDTIVHSKADTSDLYAQNAQRHMATQVKKIDDNTVQNSYLSYLIESDFADQAQSLGFEDMPIILENGNRIDKHVTENRYKVNTNGEDTLDSITYKRKISTLSKEDFLAFQNNLSKKDIQETINLSDDYFTSINKYNYNNDRNISDLVPSNVEQIEKRQYTKEEFSKMAENVMNRAEIGNREQVMLQALRELGVSEKLLNAPKKQMLYDMVEESINNGHISDLTSQTQIEQLLRQLNNDLVIKEDYLAWRMKPTEDIINKTAKIYGAQPNEVVRADTIEFYIDEDELYNINQIANVYLGNVDENLETATIEKKYILNNNELELLVQRSKQTECRTTAKEYDQSSLRNMDVNTALAIKSRPNSTWGRIYTNLMKPDIIVSRMIQAGKNRAKENQIKPSSIIYGENQKWQQGPGYSNYEKEVTAQDLQEAERLIATRSNAVKSGATSKVAENSEKIIGELSGYIEGDAQTIAAKAANERERAQQEKQNREVQDNITK